jgi:low temperature requirement protein LtrA
MAGAPDAAGRQPWHIPMRGRDRTEPHRASTPLELLFDLSFVVAVATAAGALHHDLSSGEIAHGVVSFGVVFFTIWWPWVNFSWFASAYDTDDVLYRLLTFVQIAGVLVVAAGIRDVFESLDFTTAVIGYVIMRVALVGQWLRAAVEGPGGRAVALRFAIGITIVQLLWVVRLAVGPPWGYAAIVVLGIVELAIPVWAERSGRHTPWHADHIAERYGLFTIIVLGECVLAATTAIDAAVEAGGVSTDLAILAIGGLVLVFGLWWSYFKHRTGIDERLSLRAAIAWGYGHYFVFAAVAGMGAGLQVGADSILGDAEIASVPVALTVAVPVVIYLVTVALLHGVPLTRRLGVPIGVASVAVLAAALAAASIGVPLAILAMAAVVAVLVAVNVAAMARSADLTATET